MKLLLITFFLFISLLYSQDTKSDRTVRLGKIDSNYVLYSGDESNSLFFSKSTTDSTSFRILEDIYKDAIETNNATINEVKRKSWFDDYQFFVNLIIILVIALITLTGVVLTNRSNRKINKANLDSDKLELETKLSANQVEVDKHLTLSLNEKWIQNFRDILSEYFESSYKIFLLTNRYILSKEGGDSNEEAKNLNELNSYYSTLINKKIKLSLFLNNNKKEDHEIYTKILKFNQWLLDLGVLDSSAFEKLSDEFIQKQNEILFQCQQIIGSTVSRIFTAGKE